MSRSVKFTISIMLILLTVFSPMSILPSSVTASAATQKALNADNVFLKQKTSITCTLASAAMLMRRTAMCASFSDWTDITEENIRETAWVDGLGLLWSFTCFNITMGHGYFSDKDKKAEILDLLKENPQGFVIYNTGNAGQSHAVLLCDYDAKKDIFYVADPASNAPEGRIPLSESTIIGETQDEQIENISAYWYIVSPVVSVDKNGNYTAKELSSSGQYDPTKDLAAFNKSKTKIQSYYVVSDETEGGTALRTNPSGNSSVHKRVNKGTILFVTYEGKNDFGATWYKTNTGHYVFSSNLDKFENYSAEITKFKNTAKKVNATYSVKAVNDKRTPLRLDPVEGNNIVAYVNNGAKLYITQSGVNSVGAVWLKTAEGYYVKNSQMKFESSSKLENAKYTGSYNIVTGEYSAKPVEDIPAESTFDPVEYKITASSLNVRKSAVDGEVIGTLANGTIVKVTTVLSGWGKISYNGSEGWISLEYAERVSEGQTSIKLDSIKLSKNIVHTGDAVECTVNVIADVPCMYKFFVYNDSGKKVYEGAHHIASKKFSYVPDKSGVYYFYIDVMFGDGRTLTGYSRNFTVSDKLQLNSVKSNAEGYVFTNKEITWTVNAASVSEKATYHYSMYLDGKLLFEKESVSSSLKYKPAKKGKYVLKVYLADDFSSSPEIASDTVSVYDSLKIDSIKLSSNYVCTNEEAVCTINASGGISDRLYCFSVYKDNKVVKKGSYSSDNKSKFALSEIGTYKILCEVKDSTGTTVSDYSSEFIVSDEILGDVNGDGKIAAGDSRLTLRHSAKIEKISDDRLFVADVNHDNVVNAADARKILRCAANLEKI